MPRAWHTQVLITCSQGQAHSRNSQRRICKCQVLWTLASPQCQVPPRTPRLSDARGLKCCDQEVKVLCFTMWAGPGREVGWDCEARERTRKDWRCLVSYQGSNSASAPSLYCGCEQIAYCLCCPRVGTMTCHNLVLWSLDIHRLNMRSLRQWMEFLLGSGYKVVPEIACVLTVWFTASSAVEVTGS